MIKLFYLEHCPYCHQAKRAIRELIAENADYGKIGIEWIEESRDPATANAYDYYYVPTVFADGWKMYEAHPGESYQECKTMIKRIFDELI